MYIENVTGVNLVPDGMYRSVYAYGTVTGTVPTYYSLHYEMVVACPKCTNLVSRGYLCKTEYSSVRSVQQKSGRINPDMNYTTSPVSVTIHAIFNILNLDFAQCSSLPLIIVKRVAKNNVSLHIILNFKQ